MSARCATSAAEAPVSVLGSGVALGVYVPALLVARRLRHLEVPADAFVLESLYTSDALAQLERMRRAYHANFAIANMAHRVPTTAAAGIDPDLLDALLTRWKTEARTRFIVWSGFWLDILDTYARRIHPTQLEVDQCRIDAVVSTSFRGRAVRNARNQEVWFWRTDQGRLEHELKVDDRAPVPFAEREQRLFVHGGGWGIGTYRERARALATSGHLLDVVVQTPGESGLAGPQHAEYGIAPHWRPWSIGDDGRHSFPPMGRVGDETFAASSTRHPAFDLVARRLAIVSKPGGGTLIDSLAAATPVILLEPYGPAEAANARLWHRLGFGMPFEEWQREGFEPAALEPCHRALLDVRETLPDYVQSYAQRLRADGGKP